MDFIWRKDRDSGRRSYQHLLKGPLAFLYLHTAQDSGDEGWFQTDWVTGLNRLIGNRLQRHSSARILEEDLAALSGRATGGADRTEQDQEKQRIVRPSSGRMLWRSHRWERI